MSIKKKFVSLALAASVAGASLTGCYGSYALFHTFHNFNGSIGNKFVASLVHFVSFFIIPVYGICFIGDVLIFNTIEFWTGSNPIAMGNTYEEADQFGNKIYAVKNADGTLSVNMTDTEGNTADFVMEREGNEVRVLNTEGEVVAFHTVRQ